MSLARVHIQATREPRKCERCGDAIPKGDKYAWFTVGFRSKYRHIRCLKIACQPRASERESSMLADVYAAQESAQDSLEAMRDSTDTPEDVVDAIRSTLTDLAEATREVAQSYRDADEAFGGGGATENGERADTLESAADDVENWDPETDPGDIQFCDVHDTDNWADGHDLDDLDAARNACEDCAGILVDWRDEQVQSAFDLVEGMELP